MGTNASALPKLARLGMSAFNSADNASITHPLSFTRFNPGATAEMIDIGRGMGGFSNLGQAIENTRTNVRRVNPSSSHKPSTGELIELLTSIFNTAPAGTGVIGDPYYWVPSASQLSTDRVIGWHDTQRFYRIIGAVISRAVFSAQSASEMTLDLEWAARDFSNSGSYPSLALTEMLSDRFLFTDLDFKIDGTTIKNRSIQFTVDHAIDNNRFLYGAVSAGPVNRERNYNLTLSIPYGLHPDMHAACNINGGAPATITFHAESGAELLISIAALRSNEVAVDASVPEEMYIPFQATCFEDFTTPLPAVTASLIL
jgi:hypothetical protein